MVDLESLEAFDAIQWLGTGQEVANRFGQSQSNVSRVCNQVKKTFGFDLKRVNSEWEVIGDTEILQLEREVHQQARFRNMRSLRLEATYWTAPTICRQLPPRWVLGRSDIVGIQRNLHLLTDRVIDASICGLPDIPDESHPHLQSIVLSRMPLYLVCASDHPLYQYNSVTLDDIAHFPIMAPPEGAYPIFEQQVRDLDLWGQDPVRMHRYKREKWEGRVETDVSIGFGTPLSLITAGDNLRRLPLDLPLQTGDALVVRRDVYPHSRFDELLDRLYSSLRDYAAKDPNITVLERDACHA